ncbi:hypothetical protein EJ04DRAFT_344704 [Polyplosphaeria fusca]|uniref:BHLH domain-containing protein n=1 Tax=Polyplosphaeria fusca TaxID=682080 RepID=A0A9P4QW61_9PLEO|nr:hypothetical protein EJ04DRAFT_344704 [Polyplosphaeria fusca]
MDFSQTPTYPTYNPLNTSPGNECFLQPDVFDKAYLADGWTSSPDWKTETFFDSEFSFDQPVNSIESFKTCTTQSQAHSNAASLAAPATLDVWSATTPTSFGHASDLDLKGPSYPSSFDPRQLSSPTPELCGDGPEVAALPSPSASPRSIKRESPGSALDADEPGQKGQQRKRGRPRLDRSTSDATNNSVPFSKTRVQRLPHNQVERKYREGLNAELERLRKAVPTLIQGDGQDVTDAPKPSKATIMASAIDYIKKVEAERDSLRTENDYLRGVRPGIALTR